jgi:hypothetical protein
MGVFGLFSFWVCNLRVISEIYFGLLFLGVVATLVDNLQLLILCQRPVVPLLQLHCVCDQSIGIMTWPSGGTVPQLAIYPFVVLSASSTQIHREDLVLP